LHIDLSNEWYMSDRVAAALEAYVNTEPAVHAWVEVSPQPPLGNGPLNGVPLGVKDIFETAGLACEYGSALYKDRKGTCDAPVVTTLRSLGAVLFGKTHTAAFGYFDPPPTRNPRNPAHTPGGSSSGSAAAVAAGVVPFALGTQTMGSIIRPASFCGITGFKPTFGTLPVEGILPFAPSLDTVGLLAESIAMCARVWRALGFAEETELPARFGIPADLPAVSGDMQSAFDDAIRRLRTAFKVETVQLPQPYDSLLAAARTVNDYEGARSHYQRWCQFGDRIGEKLAALVRHGMEISEAEYLDKLRYVHETADSLSTQFAEFPVLLTPAAPGVAPEGLGSTGNPVMNAVWTALGTPAVSIPMPRAAGLPLGLQLIAGRHADSMLLNAASRIEDRLTQ
jgi:Asp-tRNA(Asn)/Glu-tRNA(Gln) amidotransferase A subunit family amidase